MYHEVQCGWCLRFLVCGCKQCGRRWQEVVGGKGQHQKMSRAKFGIIENVARLIRKWSHAIRISDARPNFSSKFQPRLFPHANEIHPKFSRASTEMKSRFIRASFEIQLKFSRALSQIQPKFRRAFQLQLPMLHQKSTRAFQIYITLALEFTRGFHFLMINSRTPISLSSTTFTYIYMHGFPDTYLHTLSYKYITSTLCIHILTCPWHMLCTDKA